MVSLAGKFCAPSWRELFSHWGPRGGAELRQGKSNGHDWQRLRRMSLKQLPSAGRHVVATAESTDEAKIANLSASKSSVSRFTLSGNVEASGKPYALSSFLRQPAGRESMLNARALRKIEPLEDDLYRCYLGTTEFFGIAVTPVIDLQVTVADSDCLVEMLSCRFEGSNQVHEINRRFSASLSNRLHWEPMGSRQLLLKNDVNLSVSLEVFTLPFTMLPISAVEVPGNTLLQALLERLVPLFLQQLKDDYTAWASTVSKNANRMETNGAPLHHPS
ncbi:hypothetical protein CBR_g8618 [Chara braunii]|uniref:DUF1997 domain-containing protein n=1 Tax=Chara braunii TaxID=69332 RepID=A0A388JS62_CHABU|nr:hypothetical protein CBR_g8618 [Chara braunii]|eukprot:GBG60597.1 hypothetical protein CBR_g8618 [Chara braunii]